jgi:uncharacterized protein (DUF1015 family)
MADPNRVLYPFRAIRYDLAQCSDLSDLISPPYDVISQQRQAELYARSDHNFVRVELTRAGVPGRYEEAARTLHTWLNEGALVREQAPAMYVLEQEFTVGGKRSRRRGLFGLVRLPEAGRDDVLSHEGTLAEPKADRLNLMRACRAMTSPIMLMAEDADRSLLRLLQQIGGAPDGTATENDGVADRLWAISDADTNRSIARAIGGGPLYIADGHHRFETALTYRDEMRAQLPDAPPTAGFNHALALVTSAQDDGLRIFPTHRLISGLDEQAKRNLRECMEQHFEMEERALARVDDPLDLGWLDERGAEVHVLGMYAGDSHALRLVARPEALPASASVVERLDVSILHRRLVDPALAGTSCAVAVGGSISHDSHAAGPAARGTRLTYTTDAAQAIAAVDRGDYDVAFFLRPTRVADVIAAARAGERMPGKSTYFYPKVPAGLVVSDASEEPI